MRKVYFPLLRFGIKWYGRNSLSLGFDRRRWDFGPFIIWFGDSAKAICG